MSNTKQRSLLVSAFRLNGLFLRNDACEFLLSQLLPVEEHEREDWIDKIIEHLQKLSSGSPTVALEQVVQAIQECVKSGQEAPESILNVIDAFEVPRFKFDTERKKFVEVPHSSLHSTPELFDSPRAKGFLYKDRYTLIFQRAIRHKLFTPAILPSASGLISPYTLQSIEFFLTEPNKVSNATVLGLLTELCEGTYYLEDPSGTLKLDLSETRYHTGLYTENCFVLADGWYEDMVFHVQRMGFPPPETSKASRAYFGNINPFGGPSRVSLKSSGKLLKYEQENEDEMIVFLSDVWLDSYKVLMKLRKLFEGYADIPPVAFVLMGNFLSAEYGSQETHILKAKFLALAEILLEFPLLVQRSKFIFIPGPSDPAAPHIFPRPPLPQTIREDFQSKITSSIFTSNPCRIQYCTQEIVIIREDLITKMCRNTIHFPETGEIPEHFAKTIICQAHLTPMPLSVCPVYWAFDAAMQLYPLPDLIVTADQFCAFTSSFMDCQVTNPGSFPKNEYAFKVYIPASQQIQDSQIPEEIEGDDV